MERPYRPLTVESLLRRTLRTLSRWSFYPLFFLVFIPLYGLKVEGRRRLRGPAISVMNHCLYVEWFFLWHAVRPRYLRFTAEQANIQRRDLGWFNWLLGVIGIPKDSPMAVAPAISHALKRKELVHFFPEGILKERNQNPKDFMIGAAWFACRHNVPLIPVAEILTTRKINSLIPWWPPKVNLVVGEGLHPCEFRNKGEKLQETARRITDASELFIRETIQSFPGTGYPGEHKESRLRDSSK